MKKLIIIPAYNEEDAIAHTVARIREKAPDFDYVIINDCSTDRTLAICRENGFHVVNLPINLGIGGAVQTGYRYALENGYDIAVQMDGDGQHDAAYLGEMARVLEEEKLNMVIGSRFIEKEGFQSSAARRMGIRWISGLIRIGTGRTIRDVTSGFRACGPVLTAYFAQNYAQDYPEPEAIVTALGQGMRVCEVPVRMNERQGGVSSIRALKSLHYMIKVSLAILLDSFRLGSRKEKKA